MVFPREEPNPQTPGPRTAAQMARQLPQQAAMPLAVSGDDIGGLTIVTNRPSVLTGSVVADSGVTKPLPRNVRVTQRSVATAGTSMTMGNMNETDFQLVGMSGTFRIVVTVPDGWTLKAVMLDGRDVTDEPIDLRGQNATVRVVVSDRPSSVSGTALLRGAPADLDVVVFADAQGRFQIADLPAGERYVAAALEYLEEGEQDDPQFLERLRSRGTSFSLIEGQQRAIQLDAIAR
jgi:hypothetical protein